jgi:hypothetical protein
MDDDLKRRLEADERFTAEPRKFLELLGTLSVDQQDRLFRALNDGDLDAAAAIVGSTQKDLREHFKELQHKAKEL